MAEFAWVPDVEIRVNGAPAPAEVGMDLESVTVQEDLEALSMFAITLHNWDQERLRVTWSDDDLFAVGSEVRVALGTLGAGTSPVLLGEVTGLEPTFGSDAPPMLTVRGYDHRHRLARGRRTRTFTGRTDSAIASQVARDAGLRAEATNTGVVLEYVIQHNQTDLEFLQRRARLIGYEVFVRDKVLHFRPPRHTAKPELTLTVGREISEFTPRSSSLSQVGQVAVRGWDALHKQVIVGTARAVAPMGPAEADLAFGRASVATVREPVQSRAEADQRALAGLTGMALGYVQGEVQCAGDPRLRAGIVVDVRGAGETFSGPYYVTSVTHELTRSEGYRTSLEVRRTAA